MQIVYSYLVIVSAKGVYSVGHGWTQRVNPFSVILWNNGGSWSGHFVEHIKTLESV